MRKIALISAIGLLTLSCSVTRRVNRETTATENRPTSGDVLESIKEQNITDSSFFIQKAEFEITTKEGSEKYIGTVKYQKPDIYLISLKTRTGIEGARIFISSDTILVNDRINKKIYFGKPYYLKKKYGLTLSCLPLIFGDLVTESNFSLDQVKCSGDKLKINCNVTGVILNYDVDCRKRKVILVNQTDNYGDQNLNIKFEKFFSIGSILLPGAIEIIDTQFDAKIKIRILKVEYPWNGTVKFIPGKNYELIELV